MKIQHNIQALNANRNMGLNNRAASLSLEKLSSGYKVNRAGDDAAGLAISEKMRGQIRGLSMAEQNAMHGINLIQTAEGGLQETHAILQRMRELSVQSANGTYDEEVDRVNLDKEFKALMDEVDRISEYTNYNGIKLLDGSLANGLANEDVFKMLYGSWIEDAMGVIMNGTGLGFNSNINLKVSFKSLGGQTGAYMWSSYNNKDYELTFNADMISSNMVLPDMNDLQISGVHLDRIVTHEIMHAIMIHNTGQPNTLPGWYKEGVAEAVHGASYRFGDFGTGGVANQDQLDKAAGLIANFPASGEGIGAYEAGYLVVSYMDNYGGSDMIKALSANLQANQSFEAAVQQTYGKSLAQIISDMKTSAASDIRDFLQIDCKIGIADGTQDGLRDRDTTPEGAVTNYGASADVSKTGTDTLSVAGINISITWVRNSFVLQIGANGKEDQRVKLSVGDMSASSLGIDNTSISTREKASSAIETLQEAINTVSGTRADLGAMQNRLTHTVNNLGVFKENLTAAESSIRDVDMAKEMMNFTKNNILIQASQAMLAQANQFPQGVLQLLR